MEKKSIKFGILGGALEVIYVVLVAFFFWGGQTWFGEGDMFTFIIILLIFVFSAAVSGLLVLGYPFFLFMKKKYREAILTVLISLLIIFLLLIVGISFYLMYR